MSVYDVLAQAIEERRVVTFTYDGFLRVVEPFLLGTTTAGRPHCVATKQKAVANQVPYPAGICFR